MVGCPRLARSTVYLISRRYTHTDAISPVFFVSQILGLACARMPFRFFPRWYYIGDWQGAATC